jgi:hypothetical protein
VLRIATLVAAGATLASLATLLQGSAHGQSAGQHRAASVPAPDAGLRPMTGAAAARLVAGTSVTAAASTSRPGDVRLYQVRRSLLGRHEWYRQVRAGHPVVGGWYARHYGLRGRLVGVYDGRRTTPRLQATAPRLSADNAAAAVTQGVSGTPGVSGTWAVTWGATVLGTPELMVLPATAERPESALVWAVVSLGGEGAVTSYVDADTGEVLDRDRLSKQAWPGADHTGAEAGAEAEAGAGAGAEAEAGAYAKPAGRGLVSGRGRVFDPNPVVALQDSSLQDRQDQVSPALTRAYTVVDLPRLRPGRGLVGRWVRVMNANRAKSPSNRYFYSRTSDRFEQVVAYYAIDAAQAYLQRLGFRSANAHAQALMTNRFRDDNSYYEPSRDVISFGSGGVDDAEDVEIIWHEYGHAIQDDQVPDFGLGPQAGAIGEGFGDYFAFSMSLPTTSATTAPVACIADWDAITYDRHPPRCLRRVDGQLTYAGRTFDIHRDGGIWSRALFDMYNKLASTNPPVPPRDMANRIIVESHYWMHPRIGMPRAARVTVRVARGLYGPQVARVVRGAFRARGILSTAPARR